LKVARTIKHGTAARPGMTAALELIAGYGVTTFIVESASRFARDLMTQENSAFAS
jgi:hypothetical protein